ncbi:hypothetical protein [Embleya sp. NBC_00896]|uniref:hypothetical protein n=1 Tax=Embleya sp. NBC_00896 TaxID=2975961 RepID=UPI0038675D64|nr:hypothetical protein OG928_21855 [Embleya sp. NBC_00896]
MSDELGLVADARDSLVLMVSELVADAALRSEVQWLIVGIKTQLVQLDGAEWEFAPVVYVGVREVVPRPTWTPYGYGPQLVPGRRFDRGRGLGLVAELVHHDWVGGRCGWSPGAAGPTSWFLATDLEPHLVDGAIGSVLMVARGIRDECLLTPGMLPEPEPEPGGESATVFALSAGSALG